MSKEPSESFRSSIAETQRKSLHERNYHAEHGIGCIIDTRMLLGHRANCGENAVFCKEQLLPLATSGVPIAPIRPMALK